MTITMTMTLMELNLSLFSTILENYHNVPSSSTGVNSKAHVTVCSGVILTLITHHRSRDTSERLRDIINHNPITPGYKPTPSLSCDQEQENALRKFALV